MVHPQVLGTLFPRGLGPQSDGTSQAHEHLHALHLVLLHFLATSITAPHLKPSSTFHRH